MSEPWERLESLRLGSLPDPLLEQEEPANIHFEWGDEKDDPQVGKLAEGVFISRYADIRTCHLCQIDVISAAALASHMEREHGRE